MFFRRTWQFLQLPQGNSPSLEDQLEQEREKTKAVSEPLERVRQQFLEYKARAEKRIASAHLDGQQEACAILIEMIDNMERAYHTMPEEFANTAWLEGFLLANRAFARKMKAFGMIRFGQPMRIFDPSRHQAIDVVYGPDVPEGTIVQIVQHGYVLRSGTGAQMVERLLRPAQVIVASQSPALAKKRASRTETAAREITPFLGYIWSE